MESYNLIPTRKTPKLDFNFEKGRFEISGRSIPENSIEFYKPLMSKLEEYIVNPAETTRLVVNLEYLNTSSSKCLIEIFRKMERAGVKSDVSIIWHFEEEDEDMLETGADFKKIVKIPIELVPID